MVTLWLVTKLVFGEDGWLVVPTATCDVDGLSVVQVMTAVVDVMLLEATLDMMTAALAATTLILNCLVADCLVGEVESCTWTVKVYVLAVVGVPVIVPVEDRVRPAGSVPADIE